MEKKINIRKIEDTNLWDRFVTDSPYGTVFSTYRWLAAGAAAQGGNPVMLGVWEWDDLIAGVSFVENCRGPLRKANTPVLTPYGGFIYKNYPDDSTTNTESLRFLCAEKLIHHLQKKYHHVFLVHSQALNDIRPFLWQNWQGNVRYTYLIDITDIKRIWTNMRRGMKRNIEKGVKSFKLGDSISLGHFGSLYKKIYSSHDKTLPTSEKIVVAMVSNLLDSGLLDFRTIREPGGDVIAAQILVKDKQIVYPWISGSIPEKSYTGADALLIWNAIQKYSNTHSSMDLTGANIPSIAFFKKGFGGVLTPYYVTERFSSPLSRVSFHLYTKLRKLL